MAYRVPVKRRKRREEGREKKRGEGRKQEGRKIEESKSLPRIKKKKTKTKKQFLPTVIAIYAS